MAAAMRAWVAIGVALVFASGCAKADWIDRTLVTVDVTGVWEGTVTGTGGAGGGIYSAPIELVLQQNGTKVTGELKGGVANVPGIIYGQTSPTPIPIEGTVSGDRFSFHQVNPGPKMEVVLQVKGEEMTGEGQRLNAFTMTLRRRQ